MNNTFGVPGVEENCFFLKDLLQAKSLRKRINDSFELASLPGTSAEERKRLLTFVVVRHAVPGCICSFGVTELAPGRNCSMRINALDALGWFIEHCLLHQAALLTRHGHH